MITNSPPTIIAICGDPGGANAVAPVIKLLESEKRTKIVPLAYNEATSIWKDFNISFDTISDDISNKQIKSILSKSPNTFLFAGTSVNSKELEKKFINVAKNIGVPSLAILDFWLNYKWRFCDTQGNLRYIPDKIAVIDSLARDEMIAEGFDPKILSITGQPIFDNLKSWQDNFSPTIADEIRSAISVKHNSNLILFASQPQTSLYGADVLHKDHIGFDELSVLQMLIKALEEIKIKKSENIHLLVRPHPRESMERFANIESAIIDITVSRQADARNQIMTADLVTGMNSELLVEACYLECITLSLQPNLRHPDRLPTNRIGLSRAVYQEQDIKPALMELLFDDKIRRDIKHKLKDYKPENIATRNVARLIYQMIADSTEG